MSQACFEPALLSTASAQQNACHVRPCAGHPRISRRSLKAWMAGTSPAMTRCVLAATSLSTSDGRTTRDAVGEAGGKSRLIAAPKQEDGEACALQHGGECLVDDAVAGELPGADPVAAPLDGLDHVAACGAETSPEPKSQAV